KQQFALERQDASDITLKLKAGLPLRDIGEIALSVTFKQDSIICIIFSKTQSCSLDISRQYQVFVAIAVHIDGANSEDWRGLDFQRKRSFLKFSAGIHFKIRGSQMIGFHMAHI